MGGGAQSVLQRLGRIAANLLLVALVIYLAGWSARATWLVFWQDNAVPHLFSTSAAGSVNGMGTGGMSLAAYELFGRPQGSVPVADTVRQSAPETRLRLRLEGVLVSQQTEHSGAIVAGTDGVTEHYRVGDTLPGNAELVEVEPNRILIKRNGMFETLTFEDNPDVGMAEEQPASQVGSAEGFVNDIQARLDTQGAAALVAFGLRPVQDGSASGYTYDGSNAMLNAVNLKAGDIITAINGQVLGDFEQDRSLLESWRDMPQMDIEVERNGARFTVSYALPEQWR
ncbi:type II secretion system protein N [Marinobacter zhejiangensis]|uniref:Type II secretion system protein C (GspC) n=1 Tax=Marinobacter zhejiangensis TaxID=488535 RepID=A0A1I4QSN9_9GAMM|nr:type II secretion system protein N [Marinobacter zhejiangensis]SFM42740.1 type II secretion system protein C (GspC) [Marinobacter zhejiangensis]